MEPALAGDVMALTRVQACGRGFGEEPVVEAARHAVDSALGIYRDA